MENPESTNNLTLKEKAEISLEKAKGIILESIPNDEIISIYAKGSYVRDELQPDSDVDLVVILKDNRHLPHVYELSKEFGRTTEPPFQIVAYTLQELQTGEWSPSRTETPTSISIFVKHLEQLPLLYGTRPKGELFTRTDIKDLTAFISAFEKRFLPDYEKGVFGFDEIVKQVIWLVEREQRALGINPEYSWQKLAESIEDKNHIMHSAIKLRSQKEVSDEERQDFINKLKDYLVSLDEKYQN